MNYTKVGAWAALIGAIAAFLVVLGSVWGLKADQSDHIKLVNEVTLIRCINIDASIWDLEKQYIGQSIPISTQNAIRQLQNQMKMLSCPFLGNEHD